MASGLLLASLRQEWGTLIGSLGIGIQKAEETFADLARRYSEPTRHYHDLTHIQVVLDSIARLSAPIVPLHTAPALLLAGWLHDVVYDARAQDNEECSAEYARCLLETVGCPEGVTRETARLILLTRRHAPDSGDELGQILIDADLAILGTDAAMYDWYARAIRQEYAWVPEKEYRAGRSRVLEGFLARPRIYHTEAMIAESEGRARMNMKRERNALEG